MDPTTPTVDGLLTVGGLSLVTTAVVEVILRAWQPDAATKDRFGPLLAYAVAIVFGVAASIATEADIFQGILLGIIVGWASMGVHDTASTIAR